MKGVGVRPKVLAWALKRSGKSREELSRFPIADWEAEKSRPTWSELEDFARATHVSFGYFFLPEPPDEQLPISDFRTLSSRKVGQASGDLLDTLYTCQERQDWYQEYAQMHGLDKADFIGSARITDSPEDVAADMSRRLNFDLAAREQISRKEAQLRYLIDQSEKIGILVMVSSIVHNNTDRPLKVEEFRGFALANEYAPLIFINGADAKAAQIFTLAHELAHLWLGESAISDADTRPLAGGHQPEEKWCNAVAAELLVPMAALRDALEAGNSRSLAQKLRHLTRQFKVSNLVILRRMHDAGALDRESFTAHWNAEQALIRKRELNKKSSGGGAPYRAILSRVSPRFARALLASTTSGETLYTDAYHMLRVKKTRTLDRLAREVEALS